ncbi:MAG: GAF domain-containing protein [Elusimicrobia bacterium]|nr:GAF domain-containing protein [Elusimicrobiota bacterium]
MARNPENGADALEILTLAGNLTSIMDLDFLLQRIGDVAQSMLNCEASSIMLLDEERKSLYFKLATGAKGSVMKKMVIPVGQGIAGWVAEHKETVVVNDTKKDPRFAGHFDKASGFVTRQLLAVPMIMKGELIGVAEVLNRRDNSEFTDYDVKVFTSLANLAAAAISNTRQMQTQKNFFSHVLEMLGESIEAVSPKLDSHPANTAYLACAIARKLGVEDADYRNIYYAGLLHDIGYIGLKNRRLVSEASLVLSSLPPEEQHVAMSVKMLEGILIFRGALPVIRHHHEKFDGSGYPAKLSGEAIPLGARILRLVESLEELRMSAGLSGDELRQRAKAELGNGSGKLFDPRVVQAALQILGDDNKTWVF